MSHVPREAGHLLDLVLFGDTKMADAMNEAALHDALRAVKREVQSDGEGCAAEVRTIVEALHGQLECRLLRLRHRVARAGGRAAKDEPEGAVPAQEVLLSICNCMPPDVGPVCWPVL